MFWIPPLDPEAPAVASVPRQPRVWTTAVEALASDAAPFVLGVVLVNLLWIGLLLTR